MDILRNGDLACMNTLITTPLHMKYWEFSRAQPESGLASRLCIRLLVCWKIMLTMLCISQTISVLLFSYALLH